MLDPMLRVQWVFASLVLLLLACGEDPAPLDDAGLADASPDATAVDVGPVDATGADVGLDARVDVGHVDVGPDGSADVGPDGSADVGRDAPDECVAETVAATFEHHDAVDVIFVVENSSSLAPTLRAFERQLNMIAIALSARGLDHRLVVLSLRQSSVGPMRTEAICVPPPLSADSSCSNGTRFFHVSIDMGGASPLEQFLGTLGQTDGYREGDSQGGPAWVDHLRPDAAKALVFVTHNNARMVDATDAGFVPGSDPSATADWFESSPGGTNPFNTRTLPEGILHARWGGLMDGYVVSGIYGFGDEDDATVRCRFGDGSNVRASGLTYTELVARTGGVRVSICDGDSLWAPFATAFTESTVSNRRVQCSAPIPPVPDGGTFEPEHLSVAVRDEEGSGLLVPVAALDDCDAAGGWAYDDDDGIALCPATCEAVQGAEVDDGLDFTFGCPST